MRERVRVVISGLVQGVGFRYATAREAAQRGLGGWVRNRADGSVEAEFEGDRSVLEDMVSWCGRGTAYAQVTQVRTTWLEVQDPSDREFRIRGW